MPPELLSRFSDGELLLLAPSASASLNRSLYEMTTFERSLADKMQSGDDFWPAEGSWMSAYRPYLVRDGVLQIPVRGYLAHDFAYQLGSWATGYEYIQKAVERGSEDSMVKGIAFMVSSYGGEVAGNFDLVDRIYEVKGMKPMRSVVNEVAASAAFSIASVADIWVPRTGVLGSVGVVTAHVNMAAALEKYGYEVTLLFSGDHKVDGNPYEKLPKDVKATIQARLDSVRELFAKTVARNLGLSVDAVLETEARVYGADDAVAIGFAHGIKAADVALAAYQDECNGRNETTNSEDMMADDKDKKETADLASATEAKITAAREEGLAAGKVEGAAAERTRIAGILGCEEATSRGTLAMHLATSTDMTIDAAKALLAAAPVQEATQAVGNTPFERAMASTPNPEVGAGAAGADGGSDQMTDVQRILADQGLATGRVPKAA